MNNKSELHRSMGMSFFRIAVVFLLLAGGSFAYKNHTGYTKVEKVGTIRNCDIKIWSEQVPFNTKMAYYLSAVNRGDEYIDLDIDKMYNDEDYDIYEDSIKVSDADKVVFQGEISYSYSHYFAGYREHSLTIYKTAEGKEFPVYKIDCDEKEAEREYRKLDPPGRWYWAYGISGAIGLMCLFYSISLFKVAANYANENYEFRPQFYDTSTASAMLDFKRTKSIDRELRDFDRRQGFIDTMVTPDSRYGSRALKYRDEMVSIERDKIVSKYDKWK